MPSSLLFQIARCIELGKVDCRSPHPADLAGQNGADEWTRQAIDEGLPPAEILHDGLIAGMGIVGTKFRDGQIFLPDVLMSAKAMTAAMKHLEPHFLSGDIRPRGTVVLGTVKGDLHDIGKKIVSLFFQGEGWKVVDLGVDVSTAKFLAAIETHKPVAIGLSALLTTTMLNMEGTIREVKAQHPSVKIIIGGAPVTAEFARKSGADGYAPDPQGGLEWLAQV
jgi:5-methyltetrahydrofolate--homocysteine methyltransferase